jgi:hypothetical protein
MVAAGFVPPTSIERMTPSSVVRPVDAVPPAFETVKLVWTGMTVSLGRYSCGSAPPSASAAISGWSSFS